MKMKPRLLALAMPFRTDDVCRPILIIVSSIVESSFIML